MTISKFLNPKNDIAFKKIFGTEKHKDILIRFINDILGLEGDLKVTDVSFFSTIQDPEIAAKKQSIVDALCKDMQGSTYIVEMQVASVEGFEKRAQYYAAKAYSRQLNKGDNKYEQLKEVIFIAVANYRLFPNKSDYISRHVILDKGSYEHDLRDFSFTFIELPKFKKPKNAELETTIEQWCRFFKYADETTEEELERIAGSDATIKSAYEAINQFNWSEEELFAYEQETKRIMDNEATERAAMNRAKAEGQVEGRAEGRIEIIRMMADSGMSPNDIAKITFLSVEEVRKVLTKHTDNK